MRQNIKKQANPGLFFVYFVFSELLQ